MIKHMLCLYAARGLLVCLPLVTFAAPPAPSSPPRNAIASDTRIDAEFRARWAQVPFADIAALDPAGNPMFVSFAEGGPHLGKGARNATEADVRGSADSALKAHGYVSKDLVAKRQWVDELGHLHLVFEQRLRNLPVVGGEISVHFSPDGSLSSIVGRGKKTKHAALSSEPKLTGQAAANHAASRTAGKNKNVFDGRLVFLWSVTRNEIALAWEVPVTAMTDDLPIAEYVYIDAITGDEIERHSKVFTMYRVIATAQNEYELDFPEDGDVRIRRREGAPLSGDSDVDANYSNFGMAHDYFWNIHGWSINTQYNGDRIRSMVHWSVYTRNAFWQGNLDATGMPDREYFAFGDGDSICNSMALSPEITAHEYTHAFIEYVCPLIYQGESGAINESISDIFGAMAEAWNRGGRNGSFAIDQKTWHLGEDIWTPAEPGDAMRYMDTPKRDLGQPGKSPDDYSRDWYPSRYTGSGDRGGVHINSGISNLAFKLMVTGGRHPRYDEIWQPLDVPPSAPDPSAAAAIAQQVFSRAIKQKYLSSAATFAQLRAATVRAASELAAAGAVPQGTPQSVHLAWDAVGVGLGGGSAYPTGNARPINISTRCDVGAGAELAVAGFSISGGSTPQELLVRGVGPGLQPFGVSNYLPDPTLELYSGGSAIASNDNWSASPDADAIASTGSAVGAFPLSWGSLARKLHEQERSRRKFPSAFGGATLSRLAPTKSARRAYVSRVS